MTCKEIEEKLELYALKALSIDEENDIRIHLNKCCKCSKNLKQINNAIVAFKDNLVHIADNIEDKYIIMNSIDSNIKYNKKKNTKSFLSFFLKIAALLVIGIFSVNLILLNKHQKSFLSKLWQQNNILPCKELDIQYPIIRENKAFAFKRSKTGIKIIALNRNNGETLWVSSCNVIPKTICTDQDNVYVWGYNKAHKISLLSINQKSGLTNWIIPRNVPFYKNDPPKISIQNNNLLWIANKTLYASNKNNGSVLWKITLNTKGLLSNPITKSGKIFIASDQKTFCINAINGNLLWSQFYSNAPKSFKRPLITSDNNNIFISRSSIYPKGTLVAIDMNSGNIIWKTNTHVGSHIKVVKGTVFVRGAFIEAINAVNGEKIWSKNIGGCSNVACNNNQILLVSSPLSGKIVSLDMNTGKKNWSFVSGGSCSGLVIDDQENGYLVNHSGMLNAIYLGTKG